MWRLPRRQSSTGLCADHLWLRTEARLANRRALREVLAVRARKPASGGGEGGEAVRTRPCPITQGYCDDPECGPACVRSIPLPAPAPEGGRPLEMIALIINTDKPDAAKLQHIEGIVEAAMRAGAAERQQPPPAAADAGRPALRAQIMALERKRWTEDGMEGTDAGNW